jgi:LuxR family maltose regulon positive regulatory protein
MRAEEVLERQPGRVREFLLQTSVLERLSGELCDTVTGRPGSLALLEQTERAGLFVVPLDEVRGGAANRTEAVTRARELSLIP